MIEIFSRSQNILSKITDERALDLQLSLDISGLRQTALTLKITVILVSRPRFTSEFVKLVFVKRFLCPIFVRRRTAVQDIANHRGEVLKNLKSPIIVPLV